jgi:hypothetical protein
MSFYKRVKTRWSVMTRAKLAKLGGVDGKTVNAVIKGANGGAWIAQALLVLLALKASGGLQTDIEDFLVG